MEKLIIKKCLKCESLIDVIDKCNCLDCDIMCCGHKMMDLIPNSLDASFEKHVPVFEVDGDSIIVRVNHVMESDHYIKWICFFDGKNVFRVNFLPNEKAECRFKYVKGAILYSYCNKHGLWSCNV